VPFFFKHVSSTAQLSTYGPFRFDHLHVLL
jgi:hypothetical protein